MVTHVSNKINKVNAIFEGVKAVALLEFDIENIFNKKAEDIFNEKLGDIVKYKNDLDHNREMHIEKLLVAKKALDLKKNVFDFNDTTTTEKNVMKFTTTIKNKGASPTVTIDEIKLKMKKAEINMLLRGGRTYIPNFVNDDDDPNQLTKHFDLNITIPHSRRVYYHVKYGGDVAVRLYQEKMRLSYIMIQFIYMTRRQMGYMSVLRNKYKNTLRYQIGYLFGLRRMVKTQQMILFKTLNIYAATFDNAQLHLQFFYRIVMLAVDVDDINRYIIKLNYKQNLEMNPRYYVDSAEYFGKIKSKKNKN